MGMNDWREYKVLMSGVNGGSIQVVKARSSHEARDKANKSGRKHGAHVTQVRRLYTEQELAWRADYEAKAKLRSEHMATLTNEQLVFHESSAEAVYQHMAEAAQSARDAWTAYTEEREARAWLKATQVKQQSN